MQSEEMYEKCIPSFLEQDLIALKEGIKNKVSYIECLVDEL